MTLTWGSLESHNAAWIEAKQRLGVDDVRDLSVDQYRAVLQLAEQIRKENFSKWQRSSD